MRRKANSVLCIDCANLSDDYICEKKGLKKTEIEIVKLKSCLDFDKCKRRRSKNKCESCAYYILKQPIGDPTCKHLQRTITKEEFNLIKGCKSYVKKE